MTVTPGAPGPPGAAGFNETELNILAFPSNQAKNVPKMSFREFVTEGDQTKRIGAYREVGLNMLILRLVPPTTAHLLAQMRVLAEEVLPAPGSRTSAVAAA